jgi:hypothetical protein
VRRLYAGIGGVLAFAVLAAALTACGGTSESTARSFHEAFQEWNANKRMSAAMSEEAIGDAEAEGVVAKMLAGHPVKSAEATRFFGPDGKTPVGAEVTLHLAEPIELHSVEVPVWVTPGPHPSKPPLPILRFASYSGTSVDELKVILSMPRRELLEVQPLGNSVDPPQLTSAPIPGYKKVGVH